MQWYFFFSTFEPVPIIFNYLVEQLDVMALSDYHHKNVTLPAVITTSSNTWTEIILFHESSWTDKLILSEKDSNLKPAKTSLVPLLQFSCGNALIWLVGH
jgi:hypothetical protein